MFYGDNEQDFLTLERMGRNLIESKMDQHEPEFEEFRILLSLFKVRLEMEKVATLKSISLTLEGPHPKF